MVKPEEYEVNEIRPAYFETMLRNVPDYSENSISLSQVKEERIHFYREYFGIPPARPGEYYGGWLGTLWRKPKRWDFYITPQREWSGHKGKERPIVCRAVESAAKNSKNVARQLESLRATKSKVDVSLTIITAFREWKYSFISSRGTVDTYTHGGIDFFSKNTYERYQAAGYFPEGFPKKDKLKFYSAISITESGKTVYPVENFPRLHLVELYGAFLNAKKDEFTKAANVDPSTLPIDALRTWTVLFFIAPSWGEKVVKYFESHGLGYVNIMKPTIKQQLEKKVIPHASWGVLRMAVVRAAEAKLLDEIYKL